MLAINEPEDDANVRDRIKQYGHAFPVLMDQDNEMANQFGVFEVPVSIFIDEKGMVQKYIKAEPLPGQVILGVVARFRKQEPMKVASLH